MIFLSKPLADNITSILTFYYDNEGRELQKVVDLIIRKLGTVDEITDYYSLADEVFADVIQRYDNEQDFRGLLWSALSNKFKSEFTRQNRYKRQCDKNAISLDTPIGDDDKTTVIDVVQDDYCLADVVCGYSLADDERYKKFFKGLSKKQYKVALLIADGYDKPEIISMLDITEVQYSDCLMALRATRNTRNLPN